MSDERDESQENEETPQYAAKSEIEALRAQLEEMNNSYQQGMQSIVDTVTQQSLSKQTSYDEDPYMTDEEKRIKALEAKLADIETSSTKRTQDMIKRERELDNTVVRLAREFPEIQSDAKVQQAVVAEHNKLGKGLQDTAEGYELAVARAVKRMGLQSKAAQGRDTDDFAAPGRKSGGSSSNSKKGKIDIDPRTLEFAAMMGRDIEDPKVLEGLAEASKRQRWSKYQ